MIISDSSHFKIDLGWSKDCSYLVITNFKLIGDEWVVKAIRLNRDCLNDLIKFIADAPAMSINGVKGSAKGIAEIDAKL